MVSERLFPAGVDVLYPVSAETFSLFNFPKCDKAAMLLDWLRDLLLLYGRMLIMMVSLVVLPLKYSLPL